jgi:serine/threonine-protein kinase
MFRLLTGRHLHNAKSSFELLMKQGREPAPPLLLHAPNVSPAVAMVVDRAVAFNREQRYPDAHAMLEDVRALLGNLTPSNAMRLGGAADRAATTRAIPTLSAQSLPSATSSVASTSEIPIYLSGFSEVPIRIEPDPKEPSPALPRAPLERTMISPALDPLKKPKV